VIRERQHLQGIHRVDSADIRGDFVRLDRNERVSPMGREEFNRILSTIGPEVISSYPDPMPLNDAFARHIDLPSDFVVATNGSDSAIKRIFHAFVVPGDTVVRTDPTYAMYEIYTQIFQGREVAIKYGVDRKVPIDALRATIDASPRMICIVNPDQPTGAVWDMADLRSIIAQAATTETICLVDETYFPCHKDTVVPLVREFNNLIVTRSLSKAYGLGGLRVGFAVAQPQLLYAIGKVRGLHEVNSMAIAVSLYYLEHPELIDRYLAEIESGRGVLFELAKRHNFGTPPCPTNFQLIDIGDRLDPATFVEELKTLGYFIKGGYKAASVHTCLRVTLDGPQMMTEFANAFETALVQLEEGGASNDD